MSLYYVGYSLTAGTTAEPDRDLSFVIDLFLLSLSLLGLNLS